MTLPGTASVTRVGFAVRELVCAGSVTTTAIADAQAVLDAGADKVSVNSAAVADPELLNELAGVFGAQCVVLAIDAKLREPQRWEAYLAGGRTATGRDGTCGGSPCPMWLMLPRHCNASSTLETAADSARIAHGRLPRR